MRVAIDSAGLRLAGHLSHPSPGSSDGGSGTGRARPGLVLCHGFPAGPGGAATAGQTYPELADRLSAETGWVVLSFNFRGTGASEGDFSLSGWMVDLRAAIDHLLGTDGVSGVWLAGSGTGGSLALCQAAEDERVRGVAALAASADFAEWAAGPLAFLDRARDLGVVRDPQFPADVERWARELAETRPMLAIGKIPPRPVLLVHGADDDVAAVQDARALADAADGQVELRILTEAGHRLRHDPRAVAILLGWMERQAPA